MKILTDTQMVTLAKHALANDLVLYSRSRDEYPHAKGTPYILAEVMDCTPREVTRDERRRFMAAWRANGGSAEVARLNAQANGTWTGEDAPAQEEAEKPKRKRTRKAAPAKDAQTVEIVAPAPIEARMDAMEATIARIAAHMGI